MGTGTSEVKVAQSCPTLCDPMDYIVHGILQARILECAGTWAGRCPGCPAAPRPAWRPRFYFFLSVSFISTILSSTSLILSSAYVILLFAASRVFLISFIALFIIY